MARFDFSQYVSDAFNNLTPNLDDIYADAITYSLQRWKIKQSGLVTASGAASVSIPGMHLVGIPADVVFLMNRMSVCSFGIGALIGKENNHGNFLEQEDFAVILGRWCNDPSLSNAALSKTTAELAAKAGNKILSKELAKIACKHSGVIIGQKLGGKMGAKLGAKFGAKLGSKVAAGFIPFLGAVVGGGINLYFINEIQSEAESWYQYKAKQ